MDISFHYFAVKATARAAGFDEAKAQRIAEFSQFIDDYNWYVYFRANNIPAYVKDNKYDIVYNSTLGIINPVTTGFSDWFDMTTLILSRSQRFTVAPFHFIPQDKQSSDNGDKRTVPATLYDDSYISSMLAKLKNDIDTGTISENDALMKMGMLFHTFADTYAHQLFTGYNNKTNSVKLISVTNNVTGNDETKKYHFWVEQWIAKIEGIIKMKLPTIGHMAIAHIPDLTHLSFEMEYTGMDKNKHRHSRSNTSTFVNACNELYKFMREVLGEAAPPDMDWTTLSEKLAEGFLIDVAKELDTSEEAAVEKLTEHWSDIFNDYNFSYSSKQIKDGFVTAVSNDIQTVIVDGKEMELSSKSYSNDFYKFNLFADEHLIYLYGDHPRNWLSEEPKIVYDNISTYNNANQD